MSTPRFSIVLLGSSSRNLKKLALELPQFDFSRNKEDCPRARFVVCAASDQAEFAFIDKMDPALRSRLGWIFIVHSEPTGLMELSSYTRRHEIVSWRYLKEPFHDQELETALRSFAEESAWSDRLRRLEASERLRSFLRGFGHDLANLLLRVSSRADLAERERKLDSVKKHLTKLIDASEETRSLLSTLQTFARSELKLELAQPSGAFLAAVEKAKAYAEPKGLVWELVSIPADEPPEPQVELDPVALEGVFESLLHLYVDQMEGGQERLKITAEICTENSGGVSGVKIRLLSSSAQAFTPHLKMNLALLIAERTIQALGGWLRAETTAPEVSIWLPSAS